MIANDLTFYEFLSHFTLIGEQLPMSSDVDESSKIFVDRKPVSISSEVLDKAPRFGHGDVTLNGKTMLSFTVYETNTISSVCMSRPKDGECAIVINDKMFSDSQLTMERKMDMRAMVYRQVHRYMATLRTLEERETYNLITRMAIRYLTEPIILDVFPEDQSFFHHRYGAEPTQMNHRALLSSLFYSLAKGGANLKELQADVEMLIGSHFESYIDILKRSVNHLNNSLIQQEMKNRIQRLETLKPVVRGIQLPEYLQYETLVEMY